MSFTVNKIVLLAIFSFGIWTQLCAQIAPRVSGLEKNAEYMELLKQEYELQIKEDSVENQVSKTRVLFRGNPEQRAKYGAEILKLEGQLFDIRNDIGLLESEINAIEQEFVINNLDKYIKPTENSAPKVDKSISTHADLVANNYLKNNLTAKDYSALLNAQRRESSVINYINIFTTNYTAAVKLEAAYQKIEHARAADSIYTKHKLLTTLNDKISDSVSAIWSEICDNKSYAYSYLFDKMNQSEILANHDKRASKIRQESAELRGQYASDILASYVASKKMMLDYELKLAEVLTIPSAIDSLKKVISNIDTLNLRLPKVIITERNFIDYQDIVILSRTPYTSSRPMPKCTIYPRGTVYRILLGAYTKAQSPSIFRGVTPLCYIYDTNKRHNYYAGGFQTAEQAQQAIEQLKSAGFKRPQIVVWENGIASVYDSATSSSDKTVAGTLYRIEISSPNSDLSPAVKQLVDGQGNGAKISRIANSEGSEYQFTFFIGTFDSQAEANKLSVAISYTENGLPVKVTTIEN